MALRKSRGISRFAVLKYALSSWFSLSVLIISTAIYFGVYYYMILASSEGAYIVTAPIYLTYAIIFTSALLLTIGIYSTKNALLRLRSSTSESTASIITLIAGGLFTSCGCSTPILGTILYTLGVGIIGRTNAIIFVSSNQAYLLLAILLINLLMIYYYLGKASSACVIKNNKIVKIKRKQ